MIAALGEEAVDVDGQPAWMLARDDWVVGASRRASALLDPRYKARVYRAQGWISPVGSSMVNSS